MNREIKYTMQRGMVDYFMNLLDLPRGEVWAVIKDACYMGVNRLDNNNKTKSWCYAIIPNCEIKLRIDIQRCQRYDRVAGGHKDTGYRAEVKFSNVSSDESFTEAQVEEYVIEKILLAED